MIRSRIFAPVAYLGYSPNMLLTRPDLRHQDRAGSDRQGRRPIRARSIFSSPGVGSVSQLAVELLKLRANIELVHVPYSGAAPPPAQAAAAGTGRDRVGRGPPA